MLLEHKLFSRHDWKVAFTKTGSHSGIQKACSDGEGVLEVDPARSGLGETSNFAVDYDKIQGVEGRYAKVVNQFHF